MSPEWTAETYPGFMVDVSALIESLPDGMVVTDPGILAAFPVFWSIPSAFLAGTAAAGGHPQQQSEDM